MCTCYRANFRSIETAVLSLLLTTLELYINVAFFNAFVSSFIFPKTNTTAAESEFICIPAATIFQGCVSCMLSLPEGHVRSGSWSEIHDRAGGCSVGTEQRGGGLFKWVLRAARCHSDFNKVRGTTAREKGDSLRLIAPARLSNK